MTFGIAIQAPEAPIVEQWEWETDIATSYNGGEDRLPLLRYPRRMFTGTFAFDDRASLRRYLAMATKRFRTEFDFPLFQYQAKLKTAVAAGAVVVSVNAKRGDFKTGGKAVVIEGDKYEEVVVAEVAANSLEFVFPLTKSFSARAIVCPVSTIFVNSNANVTRANPDNSGSSSFTFIERVPTYPFVSPLNEATIATFDGLPLLPFVPLGSEFESAVSTGLQPIDYLGLTDIVSPWTFEQWSYPVTFKASRLGNVDEWEWWQLFADTIRGSANPFLFPTNREDLELVTPATSGGVGVTVKGDLYSQHYWGHGGFSRIFIDTDAGRHYAKVTGISSVAGNDRLTFAPALPAGVDWTKNQRVGFLLKVRNEDDKIVCEHYGLNTIVKMAIRTVV